MNFFRKVAAVLVTGVTAFVLPLTGAGQQPLGKPLLVGYLDGQDPSTRARHIESFRAGLRDFGYVEGKNLKLEFRWASGRYDLLPKLASELVRLKVNVIVALQTSALAAKGATTSIPIIFVSSDAVASGFASNLSRPGGNLTGISMLSPEVLAKRMELLMELRPGTRVVGVTMNSAGAGGQALLPAVQRSAQVLGVTVHSFLVTSADEFAEVFANLRAQRIDSMITSADTLFSSNAARFAAAAASSRVVTVCTPDLVEAGCVVGYGPNVVQIQRRVGYFVDRIAKGIEPRDIPVEQPMQFELFVNARTAKVLGIKVPHSILLRADKVFE